MKNGEHDIEKKKKEILCAQALFSYTTGEVLIPEILEVNLVAVLVKTHCCAYYFMQLN